MSHARFPAHHRLCRTQQFRAIQRRGSWVRGDTLALGWLANRLPQTRLGLRIRRTVATRAVVRNRAKRLLREAFRLHQPQLKPGHDVVIAIRRIGPLTFASVEAEFLQLCKRANLL